MAGSGTQLKVGVTFLLAVAILLAGILWLKEYRPGVKMETMHVQFEDSNGISAGDPVQVAGVRVGVVTNISLNTENYALVRISIDRSVNLHPDAVFQILDSGLMGDKALIVNPGTAPGVLNRDVVQKGAPSAGMTKMFAEAETVLLRLKNIAAKVDSGLDIAKLTGEFEKTLTNVQQLTGVFQTIAGENRVSLQKTLDNVHAASTDVRRFIDVNNASAAQAIESFLQTSDRLSELVVSLQPLTAVADTMAVSMRTGNGTLAQLVRSQELYNELRRTNASIDSFLVDFQRNPGKYTKNMKFKVSLF